MAIRHPPIFKTGGSHQLHLRASRSEFLRSIFPSIFGPDLANPDPSYVAAASCVDFIRTVVLKKSLKRRERRRKTLNSLYQSEEEGREEGRLDVMR